MRLGSYYRAIVAPCLGIGPVGPRVLDVGAADAQLLRRFPGVQRVALDPQVWDTSPVSRVRGDGAHAPFRAGAFDTVIALDVLEHVQDDLALAQELVRLVRPGGALWVSVPSRSFRAAPAMATAFLHRRWGHLRPGYTPDELRALFPGAAEVTLHEWNEPAYRLAYFPLKLLSLAAPPLARLALRLVARLDSRRRAGQQGHLFYCMRIPAAGSV